MSAPSEVGQAEKTKRMYVGNLASTVTRDDIERLFGLQTTPYLRKECFVELAVDNQGKSKGFAFVTVPEHIKKELLNLNDIEFYGKQILIQEAKSNEDDARDNKKGQNMNRGQYNRGGQRQNYNNPRRNNQGKGYQNFNRNRKSKHDLPKLDSDQKFNLIDCGVNLTNSKFNDNRDNVIARALAAGVQKMVVTGLKFNGVRSAQTMHVSRPNLLYVAAGIHPHYLTNDWKQNTADQLDEMLKEDYVVAVGECGLDFNRNYTDKDLQKKVFEKHVELACKHKKTLLVHDRDAHESVLEILDKFSDQLPKVVIHCFTGSQEQIKTYLERGFYIGITGYVCKEKHGKELRDAIKTGVLPLDRIVLQSNAPFMMPNTPHSEIDPVSAMLLEYCWNQQNEPVALSVTVRCIAKQLSKDGKDFEARTVADALTKTALDLFKFPKTEV